MLSVASVRSASGAATYFAKDDYYTGEHSAEASLWGGGGAAALGLAGEIEKSAFEAILNGVLPGGEAVGQVNNRQAGIDLTFSLPKSASVLAYVAGDQRILVAHMTAVRAAMRWVEANLAEGRKDVGGRKVPIRTGNLVYALFQHDTSRALDPQGHIHAVVANMTRMPDGRFLALHNGALWRNNAVIGSVYHAQMRTELETLGYRVEGAGNHGAFEIAGVPKPVIDAFSQRRQAILAKATDLGIVSASGRDRVSINTRDRKLNVEDRDALRREWSAKAAALGFDGKAVVSASYAAIAGHAGATRLERGFFAVRGAVETARELLGEVLRPDDPLVDRGLSRLTRAPPVARAQLAVASSIRILSQREAAFSRHQLAKTALDLGLPGVTIDLVERRIGELIQSDRLIPESVRRNDGTTMMVTTREALRTEERILEAVERGRGRSVAVVAAARAPTQLQAVAAFPLNAGQLAAATLILSSEDRTVVVQGVAGAGKSTMLGAVARVSETEGRRVLGLAFQNKMVSDLGHGAGIEARTIASFLWENERFADRPSGDHYEAARTAFADAIIVVDEASMVSSEDMLRLHTVADVLGVEKLVLVGDRQQLSSIDAGKSFAMIQAGGGAMARMDENIRQRTDQLRTVAALANIGRASAAMDVLGGKVEEHASPFKRAAELWLALGVEERAATAVFASGREARATINRRIQNGLIAEGTLRGEGLRLTVFEPVNLAREELRYASSYRTGQTLEVTSCVDELGLDRGRYEVKRLLTKGRVELARGGRRLAIDPSRLRPSEGRDRLKLTQPKELQVREGERIRWTANDKQRGLLNAATALILSVEESRITIETASRERVTLAPGDPMLSRLDLAYSLNMHMAQGITADKAIVAMSSGERNLSNQRLFNVSVSRVREDLRMVVDSREGLQRQLDRNPGNKTSALETVGRLVVDGAKMRECAAVGLKATHGVDRAPSLAEREGAGRDGALKPSLSQEPGQDLSAPHPVATQVGPSAPALPERSLGLDL